MTGPEPGRIKPDLSDQKGEGSNGPTREDVLFFAGQLRSADEAIKEARDARKKLRQAAKNRGIELKILDWTIAIEDGEDDTILDDLKTLKTYATYLSLPIGHQLTLFDVPQPGKAAGNGLAEKARLSGYKRGVMGLSPDEEAYPPMTEEGQEHLAGWHDGQKVNHDKFLKLNEERAAEAAAKEAKKAKHTNGSADGADSDDGE